MSITQIFQVLVAVYALTVMAPGHAENTQKYEVAFNSQDIYNQVSERTQAVVKTISTPVINLQELDCLARNIFHEAGSEPEEGKVAVGLVTLNRAKDGRFSNSLCGVVAQKMTIDVPQTKTVTRQVKTGWFGQTVDKTETQTVWSKISVCQFSWKCMFVKPPLKNDQRWIESQQVAHDLLVSEENYEPLRDKYAGALYFHNLFVRPGWSQHKERVSRVGGHIFYRERGSTKY
jgi:spore germination cell wall hydrolase CwlJ-like protein